MLKSNVLIIEDEHASRRVYKKIFREAKITYVGSGEEAIAKILENPSRWDLIISDQVLAGRIPGRDIYVHLTAYHPHLSRRFIFATKRRDELAGLGIAPNRVLSKPFRRHEMVNALQGTRLHECQAIR